MKIALVSTRGGHLTETLKLMDAFIGHKVFFVVPHNPLDQKLQASAPVYFSLCIDAKLHRFVYVFFWAIFILFKEKPDVILSLGPEIAIPFFFWGKIFGMKTIYIESWCRVNTLSLTGKIVYRWVDEFWVQWPQLLDNCGPKAKYFGGIL